MALGVGQQLAQDRQRAVQLPQRHVGTGMVARVELGEVVGAGADRWRADQPLTNRLAILAGIPVGKHHRVGVGQPVDVVAIIGEHRLHLTDVIGTSALLAAGVGDAGQQRVALQAPALVAKLVENLDALQRALLGGVQLMPLQQHLAAHPIDELGNGRGTQMLLFDVLDGPFLQGVGLLQMPLGDGDLRQLAEAPDHQVRGIDLASTALGFLVLLLRLRQCTLDEMHLGQAGHRRHPRGAHDQRLAGQRLLGQGDGALLVALVHRHLRAHRVELADDARPVLLRAAALQSQFGGLEPALDVIELVGVL